jgi:glycerate 2-kinase
VSKADVLVSLDKFRGSMSAREACAELASGIRAATDCRVCACPVADGGEGTVDALVDAGYGRINMTVAGPLGDSAMASFAVSGSRAVIELAQAAGIHLSNGNSPLGASTDGVGELIISALDRGCTEIVLAMGGTATTDGGSGMLRALGARFLDAEGRDLGPGGGELIHLAGVNLSQLDRRLESVSLIVASDVTNPLLGESGAAAVYGPQKGADSRAIAQLEMGLTRLAELLQVATGRDVVATPGAGAAGGTGFAALALGARIESGVQFVLREIRLTERVGEAELIVVGEGAIDQQSLQGKAPVGIAALALRHGVPVIAVAGQIHVPPEQLRELGIVASHELLALAGGSLAKSMSDAPELLRQIGQQIALDHLVPANDLGHSTSEALDH